MIDHHDWNQYKHVQPALKEAKIRVQQVLKPGGGGLNSTNVGELPLEYLNIQQYVFLLFHLYDHLYVHLNINPKLYKSFIKKYSSKRLCPNFYVILNLNVIVFAVGPVHSP